MSDQIDEVKRRTDIVEYIGSYVTLKKAGRNFKANCPFHHEKSPSFVVSPDRQLWHCFGACHDGGDVIKFLMKLENITFIEALRELAQRAGVNLNSTQVEDAAWNKKEALLKINTLAKECFKYLLLENRVGEHAREYLQKRGLNINIVKKFELGYAPNSWDFIFRYMQKKNYPLAQLEELGLIIKSTGGRYYDRFRNRLMFPIKDTRGNIIGFSGRTFVESPKEAKYINTPETPLYHKRETLYGIDLAKDMIRRENNVFIVEGEFDMITPYQHGYENFVAIKGSALTSEQLALLKRYTTKITLALDADAAGIDAIKKGIQEAEKYGFDISVVTFDFAKDPDEALRKDPVAFKKAIGAPIPVYDFVIAAAEKKYTVDDPFEKKKFAEDIMPFIQDISNPIVKSHYIKKVADILQVGETSVTDLIAQQQRRSKVRLPTKTKDDEKNTEIPEDVRQKYILSCLFQLESNSELKQKIQQYLESDDFTLPVYKKIIQAYIDNYKDGVTFAQFADNLPNELQSIANEVYLYASYDTSIDTTNLFKDVLLLRKNALKRRITEESRSKQEFDEESLNFLNELKQKLNQVDKSLSAL